MTIQQDTHPFPSRLTTRLVAEKLNVSTITITNYVRRGILTPLNPDTKVIDGTYYFSPDDVEKIKEQFKKKEGYILLTEAAKKLGITYNEIQTFVKNGTLAAEKVPYRGKQRFFVKEDALEPLRKKLEKEPAFLTVQQVNRHYFLFQSFKNESTGEWARLIYIDKHGRWEAKTESGHIFPLEHLLEKGFSPVKAKEKRTAITQRGHLIFQFEKSNNIRSLSYRAMEWIIYTVGANNVKVEDTADGYSLHVKPCVIDFDLTSYQDEREALYGALSEGGEIMMFEGKWLLKSNLEPITIHVTANEKEQIRQLAKKANCTMENWIKSCIFQK